MKEIRKFIGDRIFLHGWTYIYVTFLCLNIFSSLYKKNYLSSHCFADLFINYQGGFVRRGLLGSFLLNCYHAGINPFIVAVSLCFISFFIIALYLLRNFIRRKYDICILAITPLLGGFGQYGFENYRRDFMVLLSFLLIVKLWKQMRTIQWLIIANIIFSITLLCYEPFIFFALPFVIALTKIRIPNYGKAIFFWLPSIVVFALTCFYSGNKQIYNAIVASTSPFLSNPGIMNFLLDKSTDVMRFHLNINMIHGVSNIPSVIVSFWILSCMIYLTTNIIAVYSNNKETWQERRYILTPLLFSIIFLLPMFTILSIDYARIYTSAVLCTFIIYFSLTTKELNQLLPKKLYHICENILCIQDKYLKPTATKMIFIILFVGLSQCSGMGIIESIKSAQLGTIIRIVYHQLSIILS